MGRKIPGKKHRGVKDPEAQKAAREEKLKTKVNSLPSNVDEQEVPKKWARLMAEKEKWSKINEEKKRRTTGQNGGEDGPPRDLLDSTKFMRYFTLRMHCLTLFTI